MTDSRTQRILRWLPRLPAQGGTVSRASSEDSVPCTLSPGREITDPDDARSLGLNVDADRLERRPPEPRR